MGGVEIEVAMEPATAARLHRSRLVQNAIRFVSTLGSSIGRHRHRSLRPAPPQQPVDEKASVLWEQVSQIGWYHTIDLGHGVVTPGFIDNRSTVDNFGLPKHLYGKRCLDIGTYDGFWAFEMERRGAAEVVAIDVDSWLDYDLPRSVRKELLGDPDRVAALEGSQTAGNLQFPGEGFRVASQILGSSVERVALNIYDLSPQRVGMFDVVLISQLLLRLRDPQRVLENMSSVCRGFAVVAEPYDPGLELLTRPLSEFIGTGRVGAWWMHSIKSMTKMMQSAGFDPVEEVGRYPVSNRVGTFNKVILKGYAPHFGPNTADG